MNRRNFAKAVALLPLVSASAPRTFAALAGREQANGSPLHALQGAGNARYELTLQRVLHGESPAYTDSFVLADVRPTAERRFTEYSGDVSGRYIGALATAARVYGADVSHLDSLLDQIVALQKSDGYFGAGFHFDKPTDADMALLWGNGRLLVGLLEYYQLRPSAPVLTSCKRIGDFLVRISPLMLSKEIRDAFGAQHFASSYICWTQQTEGLALLYAATKDERYRKLTEEIAAVIERRPGDHAHGYLSSLRGVMDLYEITLDQPLLRQCEAAWQDITSSQDLLITGGVPEGWSPNGHRTEGCAEADWVRLNLALWKATTDQKYLVMAERAVFNELAFNQYASGDFGHRVYTETGLPAVGAVRAWWCCTLHGLRCFPDISQHALRVEDRTLWFDLPVDGQIDATGISARSESTLARDGTVRITIERAGSDPIRVGVRRPSWSEGLDIQVNGKPAEPLIINPYLAIQRTWSAGDVIEVRYAMKLRSFASGENRVSYSYGPWLLGAPANENPAFFNELTTENKLLAEPQLVPTTGKPGRRTFGVPIAAMQCRFAQAEYPDQPGQVELRAIAEQTGRQTTSWELRFLTQKQS